MKFHKNQLLSMFLNIATSGKYNKERDFLISDYLIRYALMNIMIVLGCVFVTAQTAIQFKEWSSFRIFTQLFSISLFFMIFILARTRAPQLILSLVVLFFWVLFCVLTIWDGKAQGANFVFIYVFPLLAIVLLGMRIGVILSVAFFSIVILEMFIPGMSKFIYHTDISIRVIVSFFLVFIVMIITEFTRKTKDRLIEKQKKELQDFNENLQKMVEEKTENVLNLQNAVLKTMAELVECRDDITGGHIERTQRGMKILLEEIKKIDTYREEICDWNDNLILQSCQLHDVGKISISDSILKKPDRLNSEEFEEMKKHTSFGEQIIEKIKTIAKESDFLKYAKLFTSSHHEKWDGSGYPRGLKGNNIPLLGRIMAIADVYDALISVRPYKKAFTHDEAEQIIIKESGTHFDPILVELFKRTSKQFKRLQTESTTPP
jgi:HD-GYP domain-containing protein (c-di-GMP phosphodiesterase class II)